MKRVPVIVLLALATVAVAWLATGASMAGQDATNVVTLEKLYDQQDQALANMDAEKFLSFFDPDSYAFIDEKGKHQSYQEYRDDLQRAVLVHRNIDSTTKVKEVQNEDGKLVAYIEQTSHFEVRDEKEGWVPFNQTSTAEETWVDRNGEWKLALTKTLRSKLAVDEKWLKTKQDISDGWYNAIHSKINSCNYSIQGCR
jgi:hypothetical protein